MLDKIIFGLQAGSFALMLVLLIFFGESYGLMISTFGLHAFSDILFVLRSKKIL
jgi:hypothetical protein